MDMKEYIVREDRGKLLLYTLLNLCLTILLMLLTIYHRSLVFCKSHVPLWLSACQKHPGM